MHTPTLTHTCKDKTSIFNNEDFIKCKTKQGKLLRNEERPQVLAGPVLFQIHFELEKEGCIVYVNGIKTLKVIRRIMVSVQEPR